MLLLLLVGRSLLAACCCLPLPGSLVKSAKSGCVWLLPLCWLLLSPSLALPLK